MHGMVTLGQSCILVRAADGMAALGTGVGSEAVQPADWPAVKIEKQQIEDFRYPEERNTHVGHAVWMA